MKRIHFMMIGLTLAGLWLGTPCSHAGEKKHHVKKVPPPPPSVGICYTVVPPTPMCPTAGEDRIVQELVKILDDTSSPQTLLATTLALMPMGKKAQSAVPAIIRNAERLKVFEPLKNMSSAKAENAALVLEAILVIQMDMPLTKEMLGMPGGPFGQMIQIAPPPPPTPLYPPAVPYGAYGPGLVPPSLPAPAMRCPAPCAAPEPIAAPKATTCPLCPR